MDNDKIIKDIQLHLTEDREKNRQYIINELQKYINNDFNLELTRKLSKLFCNELMIEESQKYNFHIRKIEFKMKNENVTKEIIESLIDSIKNIISKHPLVLEDHYNEYHKFTTPTEEKIFIQLVESKKEYKIIPDNQYPFIYMIMGELLNESNQLNESMEYLEKAIKINPVSAKVYLNLALIYAKEGIIEKFKEYTIEALKYAYDYQIIASCYRKLGRYYYIKENYVLSAALLLNSLNYENKKINELFYIKNKGYSTEYTKEEIITILYENDIYLNGNGDIIKIIENSAREYEKNSLLYEALYCYGLLLSLTCDKGIYLKIKELNNMISKKK